MSGVTLIQCSRVCSLIPGSRMAHAVPHVCLHVLQWRQFEPEACAVARGTEARVWCRFVNKVRAASRISFLILAFGGRYGQDVLDVCRYFDTGVSRSSVTTDWTVGRSKFDPRQRQKDVFLVASVTRPALSKFLRSCLKGRQNGGLTGAPTCLGTALPVRTDGTYPEGKVLLERDADHSPSFSAEVKND
jgi:hypothetical protein